MPQINITGGYYDLTNTTSQGDIFGFVNTVNDLTNGYFMLGVLLVGFVILFLSTQRWGTKEALVSSSFVTAVLSVLFLTLNFINVGKFLFLIVPTSILIVMGMLERN